MSDDSIFASGIFIYLFLIMYVHNFLLLRAESIYGEYKEFQAVLRSDGAVRWEPGGVFKTMCGIDITYYPFDEQSCDLTFGAWSYYTTKMNLSTDRLVNSQRDQSSVYFQLNRCV